MKNVKECIHSLMRLKHPGVMNTIVDLIVGLVIIIAVMFVGISIGGQFQTQAAANSLAANITASTMTNFTTVSNFIPIVVVAVIGMAVISLFYMFRGRTTVGGA